MKLQTTIVFKRTHEAYKQGKSIIIHQGGTRSSKTYNILIWLIVMARSEWNNYMIDITRDTMTSLRVSAMQDFFEILEKYNWYDVNKHNRSNNTYKIGTNTFRFFGADEDKKVRGPGRDILFCNEMNGMKYKTYKQLNQRTKVLTIGDYNPSDEFHWIYDDVITDSDCAFFKTTFRDNPFLPSRIIKEIKKYKEKDPNYWRIYGLGERGVPQATIYSNWHYAVNRLGREISFQEFEGQRLFGMDFGFNNPTTLLRIRYHERGGIFAEELLYKTELTSEMIIMELDKLRLAGKITYDDEIIADSSRPEIIRDIKDAGYNIHKSKKGTGSVLRGINFLKMHKIFITKNSFKMIKEIKSYKWKVDKDDHVLDSPVEVNDHLMDALRYAVEKLSRKKTEVGVA